MKEPEDSPGAKPISLHAKHREAFCPSLHSVVFPIRALPRWEK
jgi:hypothetical protein